MRFFKLPSFFINWVNRLSIATKVTLVFSVLVLLATVMVGFLVYYGNSRLVISSSKEALTHSSQVLSVQFSASIKGLQDDIKLLSKNPVFQTFTQNLESSGGNITQPDLSRRQLAQLFRSLLESRPGYLQVSFISAAGKKPELVRTDQTEGTIIEVPAEKLGSVNGLLYFDEVKNLVPNQVYLSEVALFRNSGVLHYPFTPAIKASLPVYNSQDQLLGVVLISLSLKDIFNHLQALTDRQATLYLTNKHGDYLIHPDNDKTFGFDRGKRWLMQNEFPESKSVIAGNKITLQFDEAHTTPNEPVLLNLERIYLFNDQERYLVLGLSSPYSSLLAGLREVRNSSLILTLAICVGGMLLTLLFSRFLIRPLQQMTQAVADFAAGKKHMPVPADRQDEIGILAQAFRQMSDQIQSQMQELAYKEQSIRAIIETTVEAIIIFDRHGLIETFNKAAETIFGYQAEKIIGKPINYILSNPLEKQLWQKRGAGWLENSLPGQGRETTATRQDGTTLNVYLSLSTFTVNNELKFAGIIHDISARKKVEAELIQAKQLAEEANIAKDEFLSVISHEIRTPMNAVIGMTRLLLQNNPDSRQLPIIHTLKFSGDNLMALINDILDYSKIKAGKIEFEAADFNIKELVSKIIQSQEPRAQEKGILLQSTVDANLPDLVKGDSVRLTQILNNLVGNAVKFTERGAIQVSLALAPENPDGHLALCFQVADTGIGIAPDRLPFIFERFTQGSSDTTRKYGGSGLGLAITKNLVELQGGTIEISSHLDQGSVFRVYLPFARASAPFGSPMVPPVKVKTTRQDLQGLRLLYVEDVPYNQFLVQNYLAKTGITLHLADNGKAGIALAWQEAFDLILMDIQMPDMDGFQTTQAIREFNQQVPIVAITAMASDKTRNQILQAGMNDYILKPVDQDELLNKIAFYMRGRGQKKKAKIRLKRASVPKASTPEIVTAAIVGISQLAAIYDQDTGKLSKALALIREEMLQYNQKFCLALELRESNIFSASYHKIQPHLQLLQLHALSELLIRCRHYISTGEGDGASLITQLDTAFTQILSALNQESGALGHPVA